MRRMIKELACRCGGELSSRMLMPRAPKERAGGAAQAHRSAMKKEIPTCPLM